MQIYSYKLINLQKYRTTNFKNKSGIEQDDYITKQQNNGSSFIPYFAFLLPFDKFTYEF